MQGDRATKLTAARPWTIIIDIRLPIIGMKERSGVLITKVIETVWNLSKVSLLHSTLVDAKLPSSRGKR